MPFNRSTERVQRGKYRIGKDGKVIVEPIADPEFVAVTSTDEYVDRAKTSEGIGQYV